MPKARSGYEALPAHDELDEEEEEEETEDNINGQRTHKNAGALPHSASVPLGAGSAGPGVRRIPRRTASNSSSNRRLKLDIRQLDEKLQQWVALVGRKFARPRNKNLRDRSKPYDIVASAFGPVEPNTIRTKIIKTLDHEEPMSRQQFDELLDQIRVAIRLGVNPKLNRAGTSGSYFAKTPDTKTRGIFKPKNEEPYGSLNPKWSKWFHRHVLGPFIGFGRACLIPNFSYLSEAGASLLSARLSLYIVPHTDLVSLSSPSFFYDWIDRRAYKQKKRPLPEKIGSFQVFLDGFKDASDFLKEHPWPGRAARDTLGFDSDTIKGRRRRGQNWTRSCRLLCGAAGVDDDSDSEEDEDLASDEEQAVRSRREASFVWTKELMHDFRLELEKLVILDVLMRNTDRGLDNFMIKICDGPCRTPSSSSLPDKRENGNTHRTQPMPRETLTVEQEDTRPYQSRPHVHIAAIDNSLSFPIHHPNSWRVYPYGWLFLPSSLIGRPFSRSTREHFLPLLTNPLWLAETVFELRKLFSQDEDFNERMFKKQIALLKGQAWNIVMSLRNPEEGPLELCRRTTCVVHDDEQEMADDEFTKEMIEAAAQPESITPSRSGTPAGDLDNGATPYRPMMGRHMTTGAGAAMPKTASVKPIVSRHSSDRPVYQRPLSNIQPLPRPLPISKHVDLTKSTFGNATGVRMMEHMERIQRREEDMAHTLGVSLPSDLDLQDDVRHSHARAANAESEGRRHRAGASLDLGRRGSVMDVAGRSRSGSIDEVSRRTSLQEHSLSRSVPPVDAGPVGRRVVIVERVEQVDARPYFARC